MELKLRKAYHNPSNYSNGVTAKIIRPAELYPGYGLSYKIIVDPYPSLGNVNMAYDLAATPDASNNF